MVAQGVGPHLLPGPFMVRWRAGITAIRVDTIHVDFKNVFS